MNFYSDNDPHAAQWIRNLIAAGLIGEGIVDERSVKEIQPSDLAGIRRVHLFAGIAAWEYALSLAGWPAGREVWTGSCPCQPFSQAGKRKGEADERHLWPEMRRLIFECRPATVFGEQVASGDGREWLARVRADLEALGYVVGAADLCAAGEGAPHIRQRLFWVAYTRNTERWQELAEDRAGQGGEAATSRGLCQAGGLADRDGRRQQGGTQSHGEPERCGEPTPRRDDAGGRGGLGWVDASPRARGRRRKQGGTEEPRRPSQVGGLGHADGKREDSERGVQGGEGAVREGGVGGPWVDFDILPCRDGKKRRVESGSFPLVDGAALRLADGRTREDCSRAAILRGVGNSIIPQVAATFIRAFLQAEGELN